MYSDRKNLYSVGMKNIRICSKAKLVKQSKVSNPQRKKPKYKDLFIYFILYIYIFFLFYEKPAAEFCITLNILSFYNLLRDMSCNFY